jgi:DMSO/TMAO reductase YedYZ molybdopterin-dependent catalytic subunit
VRLSPEIFSRRQFFLLSAGVLVQSTLTPPRLSSGQAVTRDLIVRSTRPLDLEMPLSGFSQYLTPIDSFFVRSHVYTPRVDASQWKLSIGGDVERPLSLTLDELKRLPSSELVSVLECAGNGRRFYDPSVPGLQWGHGAVGNARWRGVRLADVLKRAGIRSSAGRDSFRCR